MKTYSDEYIFKESSIQKQIEIHYGELGNITNNELECEKFEYHESICSESQLEFGCCESKYIKFTVGYGVEPLIDKRLSVRITPQDCDTLFLGFFYVVSDTPTADRRKREIVAYDKLYFMLNENLIDWYNTIFPTDTSTITGSDFCYELFTNHWGIGTEVYFGYITAGVGRLPFAFQNLKKTVYGNELTGKRLLHDFCEMNFVMGSISADENFRFTMLSAIGDTLYPAEDLYPADDLYPQEGTVEEEVGANGTYITAKYEDYYAEPITKLIIRTNENDVGYVQGTGDNPYIIEDNLFLYGYSSTELANLYQGALQYYLSNIYFTPAQIEAVGNPVLECGDRIRVRTKYATIDTYILQRTLKGIQALRDTYIAESPQKRSAGLLTTNHSLIALRGKTNELTRTIEETNSRITDVEVDLSSNYYTKTEADSEIRQTARQVKSTVAQYDSKYDTSGLLYTISLWGYGSPNDLGYNPADYNGVYYLDNEQGETWLSNGTRWSREDTLDLITDSLQTEITQNATDITAKVSKTDHNATNTFGWVLDITGFDVQSNGNSVLKVNANGAEITGTCKADAGHIGDFTIDNGVLKYNELFGTGYLEMAHLSGRDEFQLHGSYQRIGKRDTTLAMDIETYGNMSFYTSPAGNMSFVCNSLTQGITFTSNKNIAMSANAGVINFDANQGYNMYFTDAQTADKHLTVFGDVTATSFTNASDRALKFDIMEIPESVINALGKVELKQFRFKDDTRIVFGAIAQDLKKALDEAGMEESDYRVLSHFGEENYYALNYIDFLVVKNAYLEKRIDDLEKRLEQIERRLNNE